MIRPETSHSTVVKEDVEKAAVSRTPTFLLSLSSSGSCGVSTYLLCVWI